MELTAINARNMLTQWQWQHAYTVRETCKTVVVFSLEARPQVELIMHVDLVTRVRTWTFFGLSLVDV